MTTPNMPVPEDIAELDARTLRAVATAVEAQELAITHGRPMRGLGPHRVMADTYRTMAEDLRTLAFLARGGSTVEHRGVADGRA